MVTGMHNTTQDTDYRKAQAQAQAPEPAQALAALRFSMDHGKNWKYKLRQLWLDGNYRAYGVSQDDCALLQQLRNQLGPMWLRNVTREDLFVRCGVAPPLVLEVVCDESPASLGWVARAFDLGLRITTSGGVGFGDRKHIARDEDGNAVIFKQGFGSVRKLNTLGLGEAQMRIVSTLQQTGVLIPSQQDPSC